MADVGTIEKLSYSIVGDKALVVYKLTGDGSGTTVPCQVGRIIAAWTSNGTETAGYSPQLSWSGHTVTYGAAPTSTKVSYLFVLGRP